MSVATASLVPLDPVASSDTGTIVILFATESGNAEAVAKATQKTAAALGLDAITHDMADVTPEDLAGTRTLLVIAATAGDGEPPERAMRFFGAITSDQAPAFAGSSYAVLALGDRAYPTFCGHGEKLDARLEELGGERLAELVRCDFEYDADASAWIAGIMPILAEAEGASRAALSSPIEIEVPGVLVGATVREHDLLHGPTAEYQSAHIALEFDEPVDYQPGDLIDIVARNDPAVVTDLLNAAGIDDPVLADRLRTEADVTTLTMDALMVLARRAPRGELGAFPTDPVAAADYVSRSRLADAIRLASVKLDHEELFALLRPIAPRSFSIASSPLAMSGRADLLVAELSWFEPRDSRGIRHGVASFDLISRRTVGDALTIRVKPSPHFRLPDPATDIIMIGAGSGVAPFRGFLQHRRLTGATGRSWLFFGHRRSECDFLYEDEWRELFAGGSLSRLESAFSRDQVEKVYVQHLLEDAGDDLAGWIAAGAVVYICGSRLMGTDCERVLDQVLAPLGLTAAALARSGRLLKDTY